ncbi:MAG: hypothetical protein IJD63_00190 [Oscillospiraceae bacterium]|nr:hypothetical protein [Oscillospiraceae bacterium]
MFGFVMADIKELTHEQQKRYNSIYCGICRRMRLRSGGAARLGLSYDVTFLAMLLMSLYEPEEEGGKRACNFHPIRPRPWVDNEFVIYGADMNIALAYYNALDDLEDEGKLSAKAAKKIFEKEMDTIRGLYPEKCRVIEENLAQLRALEKESCPDPDKMAACFGALLGELFLYKEDLWADRLRSLGDALGRFIYLADAAIDYRKDGEKGQYNPFIAANMDRDWDVFENILVSLMERCTGYFEQLPLVQDKKILDNILYGGIWLQYRQKQRQQSRGGTR